MASIKSLPQFAAWLDTVTDAMIGGVEPVGEGVSETRIHAGAGWRWHFTQRGAQLSTKGNNVQTYKVDDLPEFDATPYRDSEETATAYLTGHAERTPYRRVAPIRRYAVTQ